MYVFASIKLLFERVSTDELDTGDCHVAALELVAVSTWPAAGAVAALTLTLVVALLSEFAVMVFVASVMVLLVMDSVLLFVATIWRSIVDTLAPVLVRYLSW
jgi:hypothetical protein